ncbi:MAG: HAMP domain-containing sensor histidine kinase [Leptospirales bacterium]
MRDRFNPTKRRGRVQAPRSLFFHLVFILVLAAISIHGAVILYFQITKGVDSKAMAHFDRYVGYIVQELGDPPLLEKGMQLRKEIAIEIVFEPGKNTNLRSWKTDPKDLGIAEMKAYVGEKPYGIFRGSFYRIENTKNGQILFLIDRGGGSGYNRVLPLLVFLTLVLFFAWLILRKLLLPIKKIERAFAEVSSGKLDTTLDLKRPRELAKTAQGFNNMIKRIGEMIENRERMLRDMSHELRSPLTRLKLAIDFLPKSEEKVSAMEDILELEKLISEILETYRPVSEDYLHTTLIDPSVITRKAMDAAKQVHPDIIIKSKIPKALTKVEIDTEKWSRVISNIFENAVKHGDGGTIRISLLENELEFIWKIQDEGKGISKEYREKIFEPFFQIENARTPQKQGYGLGLHLCKTIIEAHGGTIRARANSPVGTIFTITLPKTASI